MRFVPDEIVGTMASGKLVAVGPNMSCCVQLLRWSGCHEFPDEEVTVPPSSESTALLREMRIGERVWVLYRMGDPVRIRRW